MFYVDFLNMLILAILVLLMVILSFVRSKVVFYILFLSLFFTEFYWIEIQGSILKPFHFITFLVFCLIFWRSLSIFKSKILTFFVLFWIFQLTYICIRGCFFDQVKTLILFFVLLTISLNITIAFKYGFIKEKEFISLVYISGFIIVIFGLLQVVAHKVGIPVFSLRESHASALFHESRFSSFFTEPDNCGKFLTVIVLLITPYVFKRELPALIYYFLVSGVILTLTRTAIIGLFGTLMLGVVFAIIYPSFGKRYSHASFLKVMVTSLVIIFAVAVFFSILKFDEVFYYRIKSILSLTTSLREDPSLPPRKLSIMGALGAILESDNFLEIVFGKGWGAGFFISLGFTELYVKGAANLFIMLFLFSGFIGVFYWALLLGYSYNVLLKAINSNVVPELALGTAMGLTSSLIFGVLSSNFISPEFWMLFGIIAYIELLVKNSYCVVCGNRQLKSKIPE